MKAIFFSDIHLHKWEQHISRFDGQLKVLEHIVKDADKYQCPLFFAGDMFHTPKEIKNDLLESIVPYLQWLFKKYPSVVMYAISGNHDQASDNYRDKPSPSYIRSMSHIIRNIRVLDFTKYEDSEIEVFGIPYLSWNIGLQESVNEINPTPGMYSILMIHTDFKGQTDTNGVIVGKGHNFKEEIFTKFDLVVNGHIHKKGKIRENILSLGSPLQLRLSDKGGKFGYWQLNPKFRMRFSEIDFTPKYREYKSSSEIDNPNDIWVKIPTEQSLVEESEGVEDSTNLMDWVNGYIKTRKIISKRKKKLLKEIIHKAND
jgi:DNA repair exonuclease SbcCD nuclease subunit